MHKFPLKRVFNQFTLVDAQITHNLQKRCLTCVFTPKFRVEVFVYWFRWRCPCKQWQNCHKLLYEGVSVVTVSCQAGDYMICRVSWREDINHSQICTWHYHDFFIQYATVTKKDFLQDLFLLKTRVTIQKPFKSLEKSNRILTNSSEYKDCNFSWFKIRRTLMI